MGRTVHAIASGTAMRVIVMTGTMGVTQIETRSALLYGFALATGVAAAL